jgi:hypothetical protein
MPAASSGDTSNITIYLANLQHRMSEIRITNTTKGKRFAGTLLSAFAGGIGGYLLAGIGGAVLLGMALAILNLGAVLWPKLMVALFMAAFSALVGYIAGGTPLAVILALISFLSFYFQIARW